MTPLSRARRAAFRIALPALLAPAAFAAVSCPPVFTDHMVLQRDKPVAIWGTANPSESVTVTFAGQSLKTVANSAGNWTLALAPLATSFEPRTLTIRGENTLTFDDVLVGEVWLLSGQSNMEKPLGEQRGQQPTDHYQEALSQAELPNLRLFTVPRNGKLKDEANHYQWRPCSAETVEAMRFSAAGFHFGKELAKTLDAPIGLIHSSFGGSMIEAWTPRSAFEQTPNLAPLLDQPYFAWVEGVQATELYQSMILPVLPYTLRGFLWYQGEANLMHGDSANYTEKLETLIAAWRSAWHTPNAPFYFAQIAPCTYSEYIVAKSISEDGLPLFWEAQLATVAPSRNIEIIPTIDLVTNLRDIHPTNKKDVGQRFARLALAKTYGQQTPATTIPQLASHRPNADGSLALTFNAPLSADRVIAPGQLGSFEIAGADARYHPATATWQNGAATLSSPHVKNPIHARYAWDEKSQPPLSKTNQLPLYPFRTDSTQLPVLIPQFYKPLHVNLSSPTPERQAWPHWQLNENAPSQFTLDQITATLEQDETNHTLTLKGLSDNPHTLVTYHTSSEATYQQFETHAGQPAQFTFQGPVDSLTAFAIDAPAPARQAHSPYPENGSSQTLAPAGARKIQLKWNPPAHAVAYNIYLFKNEKAPDAFKKVNLAGRSSSTFLATTRDTSHTISIDLDATDLDCAWRIDTTDQDGAITRGNVWTFSLTQALR